MTVFPILLLVIAIIGFPLISRYFRKEEEEPELDLDSVAACREAGPAKRQEPEPVPKKELREKEEPDPVISETELVERERQRESLERAIREMEAQTVARRKEERGQVAGQAAYRMKRARSSANVVDHRVVMQLVLTAPLICVLVCCVNPAIRS